ncbi:hypothetical protein BBBOND_0404100 [Babesia bigemina]|uniref:Uncharacterized protein n=1 Tax=Babesia bigemina TaxID=5866 RepID=A0A061DCP5_BABBI|nr:hypothetical protein BBBOND_0404100 [Babesia bigemina]CDR97922.1 hypothetical protein BBBOND_0404100 [Babesia bigemina]|eukprot:XP_012770108.1 hypothetical protein BBBOND_0404100 [Babesia bigemina]
MRVLCRVFAYVNNELQPTHSSFLIFLTIVLSYACEYDTRESVICAFHRLCDLVGVCRHRDPAYSRRADMAGNTPQYLSNILHRYTIIALPLMRLPAAVRQLRLHVSPSQLVHDKQLRWAAALIFTMSWATRVAPVTCAALRQLPELWTGALAPISSYPSQFIAIHAPLAKQVQLAHGGDSLPTIGSPSCYLPLGVCTPLLTRTWDTNMRRRTYRSRKRKRFIRVGERILRIS